MTFFDIVDQSSFCLVLLVYIIIIRTRNVNKKKGQALTMRRLDVWVIKTNIYFYSSASARGASKPKKFKSAAVVQVNSRWSRQPGKYKSAQHQFMRHCIWQTF